MIKIFEQKSNKYDNRKEMLQTVMRFLERAKPTESLHLHHHGGKDFFGVTIDTKDSDMDETAERMAGILNSDVHEIMRLPTTTYCNE